MSVELWLIGGSLLCAMRAGVMLERARVRRALLRKQGALLFLEKGRY